MSSNEAMKWLRACAREPNNPAKVSKSDLGMLTGQDTAALQTIALCWWLYARGDDAGQESALAAVRALLPAMQPKCRFLARELIAWQLDWPDRDRLWPLVYSGKDSDKVGVEES